MAVGATLAMCGIGVFLTSLAKNEQQAFGITLLVGLALALLGGNLLPSGSLPDAFQVLALGTPNGWALVGFGRLDQLSEPASSVIGPFVVLVVIARRCGRARHDQGAPDGRAVTAVIWVNLKRAMGDRRLLIIGTLVPVVIILITGLLGREPEGADRVVAPVGPVAAPGRDDQRSAGAGRGQSDGPDGRHFAGAGGGGDRAAAFDHVGFELVGALERSEPTSSSSRPPPTPSRPEPTSSH